MFSFWVSVAFWAGLSSQVPLLETRQNDKASRPLQFSSDGNFKIAIFEDLHFGENAWSFGPAQDKKTVKVMNDVLDKAKPDFVVLNGDLITGENAFLENASFVLDQIVQPMLDRNLPWSSTYGNHDYQFNLSGSDILAREGKWVNSRTKTMVSGDVGVSNYYLPVYASDCTKDSCAPELLLWFFDSRGGFKYLQKDSSGNQVGNPNWVDESVVSWFKSTSSDLVDKHKKNITSLAFVHIPPDASRAVQAKGIDPAKEPGINQDNPLSRQSEGWCSDGTNKDTCSYGGQEKAFMQAVTATPGMLAVFSGHDHGNSWCYKWSGAVNGLSVEGTGVNLCFGQRSGYGGYGNWIRGSRQLSLTRDNLSKGIVDTSIRLESGDVVGSVTLNSTYGQDQYPVTPDQRT
ncbi:putative inactive purple acid phosphatase 16 [Colletotrichum siamense]|uniref:Inactive purple acid phosphatase 16 n=1 Tax=Colletotrichum siamense TaxID=690259 RepID=A0A9P5EYH0_COLSI|nr:putative inactive purple acid phosphatase 16 [Colletotrichum siamense]KAF4861943.1 putative inactive purple acid phosphatase 16 [Colletotrichum siamense]